MQSQEHRNCFQQEATYIHQQQYKTQTTHFQQSNNGRKPHTEGSVLTSLRAEYVRQSFTAQGKGDTKKTTHEKRKAWILTKVILLCRSTGRPVPISKTHYRYKGEHITILGQPCQKAVFYLPQVNHWPYTEHLKYYNQKEIHSLNSFTLVKIG